MFIVGGFNAYPAEIENILCDHPSISQAAVIGIQDERMGEVAKAFVVLKPNQDLNSDSLIQWSKEIWLITRSQDSRVRAGVTNKCCRKNYEIPFKG